jgi:hypothetical protein
MVTQVDLNTFVRGDTWTNKFAFTDENNAAIDITDNVYYLTLKADPEVTDLNADAQATVTATGADALAGIVYVVFSSAQTAALSPGKYFYDLQQVDDGQVSTLLLGKVKVLRDITLAIS